MALNHPKTGPNHVPSYQISGVPYVTASAGDFVGTVNPRKISFPYATRFFIVNNLSNNPMRIGFTENGVKGAVTSNYLILSGNETTERLEIRCKELFFLADVNTVEYSLLAGLTGVAWDQFPILTGSDNGDKRLEGVG